VLVGPVTQKMEVAFAIALEQWRRRWDLRLVARICDDPGPYQVYIRGGAPSAQEWEAARRDIEPAAPDAEDDQGLRAVLSDVVDGLEPGRGTVLVEVDPDGVTVVQAGLDSFGSPRLGDARTAAWPQLLPVLSRAPRELHVQLVRGIPPLDQRQPWDLMLGRIPAIPRERLLVIGRPAGWQVLDRVAEMVVKNRPEARLVRVSGTVDGVSARTVLAGLMKAAPLNRPYRLLLGVVDPVSGAVRVQDRQLFARGAQPGTEQSLPLRLLPGDGQDITLAILAADQRVAEPLVLARVDLPAGSAFRLRAVLDGPGRVRILEPEGTKVHSRPWADISREIPDRVDLAPVQADLICAIELCGPNELVQARLRLVAELLTVLAAEYPEQGRLRAAALTCTDHVFQRGREQLPVVWERQLGPVSETRAWLAERTSAVIGYAAAAPVEDMLHRASELLYESRVAGRAARLLTIAGRSPHPYPQDPAGRDRTLPCPLGHDWRESTGRLARLADARCVAVTDTAQTGGHAQIWRELGPAGLHVLPETTARLVGEDLGLLARGAQRIGLPLPDAE